MDGVERAAYDELVEVRGVDGTTRLARVLETGFGRAVVQVFEGTSGLSVDGTSAKFLGQTMQLPVSDELLGRVFDGLGRPQDGLPDPVGKDFRDVNGAPINPERRAYPTDLIQTGVSVIDGMLTLVRGQKLPIFSGAGMPHNMLAAQIARQATVVGEGEEFAVVFAAIGVQHGEASFFQRTLEESGAIRRSILYLNLADDPAIERLITPRVALTAAEYLAYDLGMHVLVILSDITNYCFRSDTEVVMSDGTITRIGKYVESIASTVDFTGGGSSSAPGHLLLLGTSRTIGSRSATTALSWENYTARPSRILSVQKVMPPKEMVFIRARSGATLYVTRDHKILVDTASGPSLLTADSLKRGQELYSIRRFDIEEKLPSLLEQFLGSDVVFYFHLRDDEMKQRLAEKYGTLKTACDKLSLNYRRISEPFDKRCFDAEELLAASSSLGISLRDASTKIAYVTAGKKGRLNISEPVLTPRWLRILGWIASDGTIYENEAQHNYHVSFGNRNRELIGEFVREVKRLFPGTNVYTAPNQDGVLMATVGSRALCRIFTQLLGVGDEELSQIFRMPEQYIAAFLAGYLDGDGSVPRGRKLVQYTTTSGVRARRLQQLFKRLGIPTIIQERESKGSFGPAHSYDVVIRGKENILRFAALVKPRHPHKRRRIEQLKERLESQQQQDRSDYFGLAPLGASRLLRTFRMRHGISAVRLGRSSTVSQFENGKRRLSKTILRRWLNIAEKIAGAIQENQEYQKLLSIVEGNFVLDRVTETRIVENDRQDDFVYDFTVSDTHTIVTGDGIVSSNCEALREISAAREEVPGRKGYPGYLYTDLATNYERAGRIKGKQGSITQMPILSMPSDDVTHPIPDLTGYITEGQIFLGRDLFRKGIYPPVYVLSSLSRLMGPALGQVVKKGKARADQLQVGNQLYNAYSRATELRSLAEIVGKSGLTGVDLKYLKFGDDFEQKFLSQGYDENRTFEDTSRIAWETLSVLPETELTNIKEEFVQKYYVKTVSAE